MSDRPNQPGVKKYDFTGLSVRALRHQRSNLNRRQRKNKTAITAILRQMHKLAAQRLRLTLEAAALADEVASRDPDNKGLDAWMVG